MKKNDLKRLIVLLATAALVIAALALTGCKNGTDGNGDLAPTAVPTEAPEVFTIPTDYELGAWTQKAWEGSVVYWEPVTFVTDINGEMPELTLMYKPTQILEVRMADGFERIEEGRDYQYDWQTNTFSLGKTITLTEGRDYTVSESGKITLKYYKQLLQVTTWESLHPKYKENQAHDWLQMPDDHSRYFNLHNTLYKSRIYVTYVHQDEWGDSYVPKSELSKLPRMKKMLIDKQDLNFVIYGDSIATGADGTGPDELVIDVSNGNEISYKGNSAPHTPSWAEMTVQTLRQRYGYDNVFKINRAAGASESVWGKNNADKLVNPKKPDVVVIAFGMNESGRSAAEHKGYINSIIDEIHAKNPDCEFILMSSMEPNPELGHTNLSDFEQAYYEIQAERTDLHIAVCPVNSVFWAVINRGKLFTDISSSNFNHPNDFLIRLYAMTLITTLGM